MNDQKQQNGNRPGQNPQNNNQQNNQQRKDLPKFEPKMQNSQPKAFTNADVEPAGQKYVSIAIIAFLLGFGAAALWFGDATSGRGGTNATSTAATSTDTSFLDDTDNEGDEDSIGTNTTPNIVVTTTPDVTVSIPATNGDISVTNQAAGKSVTVDSVTLSKPAWLAVTESVTGGVRILGAKLVDVGTTKNIKIDLLRGTLAGKTYMVVVRADNGDHVFVPAADKPVIGSNGQEFASSFTTTQ